jgi:hypothetical protein
MYSLPFKKGGTLPKKQLRATHGSRFIVIVSEHLHKSGRDCAHCGALWEIEFTERGDVHAWRDSKRMDQAILDYVGNNVAVECCQKRA